MRWAVSTRRSFNAIHQTSLIKVDVFCAGDDALTRRELERRVFFDLEVGRIPLCSSEDIILQKLVWWREAGGSERQWRDALGVVQVRGNELDRGYITSQAESLGLQSLVEQLFSEASNAPG